MTNSTLSVANTRSCAKPSVQTPDACARKNAATAQHHTGALPSRKSPHTSAKKKKLPNDKNTSSEGSASPQAHAVIIQDVQSPHKTSSLASSPVSYLYLTSQQGAREASEGTTRVCKATVYKMVQNIFSTTRSQRRAGYLLLLQLPCLLGRVRT